MVSPTPPDARRRRGTRRRAFVRTRATDEWKYYEHDGPRELRERLAGFSGLSRSDEETVLVAEAPSDPPPQAADVDLREDVRRRSHESRPTRIFGPIHGINGFPQHAVPVVAFVDGQIRRRAGASISSRDVDFAGLFGGVTLPAFRGRGLYRATVARRAEIAREARLPAGSTSHALPTSRPILERVGFVAMTTTTPFVHSSPQLAERGPTGSTVSSTCSCGSTFRSLPQTGQSPAQSGSWRICTGSARTTASCAHAERSSWSSTRYSVHRPRSRASLPGLAQPQLRAPARRPGRQRNGARRA